jgi:hypothetical protein
MKAANVGYLHGVEEELASAAVDEETTFQVVDTHNSSLSRHSAYIILGYLSIGCAFFSWSEGWPWDDALYYCVVTMTTTGYGDLVPTSNASKLFAVTYIIFGVPQTPPPQPQTLRSQIALLSTDTATVTRAPLLYFSLRRPLVWGVGARVGRGALRSAHQQILSD